MGQQRDGRPCKVKTLDGGGTTPTPCSEEVDYDDLVALDGTVEVEKKERERKETRMEAISYGIMILQAVCEGSKVASRRRSKLHTRQSALAGTWRVPGSAHVLNSASDVISLTMVCYAITIRWSKDKVDPQPAPVFAPSPAANVRPTISRQQERAHR